MRINPKDATESPTCRRDHLFLPADSNEARYVMEACSSVPLLLLCDDPPRMFLPVAVEKKTSAQFLNRAIRKFTDVSFLKGHNETSCRT